MHWKLLVYFIDIWSVLRPFDIFYGHWVYFVVIWDVLQRIGKLYLEKSGNPALKPNKVLLFFSFLREI
jgi:hypothetical protein